MEPSMEKIKIANTKTIFWTSNLTGRESFENRMVFFNEHLKNFSLG